jgi:hypothetical protein
VRDETEKAIVAAAQGANSLSVRYSKQQNRGGVIVAVARRVAAPVRMSREALPRRSVLFPIRLAAKIADASSTTDVGQRGSGYGSSLAYDTYYAYTIPALHKTRTCR